MAATAYSRSLSSNSSSAVHWQRNRLGPLGAVVLLHAGLFFALQYGLHDVPQPASLVSPKEMFASFITPEPPAAPSLPVPQLMPSKPRPKPRPAPPPKPLKKTLQAPSAISTPQPRATPDTPDTSPEQQASAPAAANAAAAPQASQTAPAQPKTISSGVEYLQPPQPRYPPLSRRIGEEGRAILRVLVNAQGMPERAEVRTSSGIARLDEAAREAVMRAQFRPHIDNGVAVAVFVIVPIRFQLDT